MIGVYVSVPVACFRKGMAREFFETHPLPPPSTCYGFLLSLVGEHDRRRHLGCRVTPAILGKPEVSVVLRTMWRVKNRELGHPQNLRPDFQQLLSHVELVVWLDSSDETTAGAMLEQRVAAALDPANRGDVERSGGLCLGESTHLVDEVSPLERRPDMMGRKTRTFLLDPAGSTTLPVWVDHIGSAGTRWVTGELRPGPLTEPARERVPLITDQEAADG